MAHLPWVKAPTLWIRHGLLAAVFSSNANVSTDIAALKIFIHCCIKSERIKRKSNDSVYSEVEKLCSSATYEDISEQCKLSRTLVSRGLAKLRKLNLIHKEGSTRKVIHVMGGVELGWCKLPCKDLLSIDNKIKPFHAFYNRYHVERDALKVFLYILSIRSNSSMDIIVSNGVLSKKTGVSIHDISGAIAMLKQVQLLTEVIDEGYHIKASIPMTEIHKLYKYRVIGAKYLCRTTHYVESDDYEGPFKTL